MSPVADYIRQTTDDDDRVLIWSGHLLINVMSDRLAIDGAFVFPQLSNGAIGLALQEDFYQRLVKLRPLMIIDGSVIAPEFLPPIDPQKRTNWMQMYSLANNTDQVLNFINANYEYVTEVDGFPVYKLKKN